MSMQENDPRRLDLARFGGIKRTRRQILASDPASIIGASSKLDRAARWFESMGAAFNAGFRAVQTAPSAAHPTINEPQALPPQPAGTLDIAPQNPPVLQSSDVPQTIELPKDDNHTSEDEVKNPVESAYSLVDAAFREGIQLAVGIQNISQRTDALARLGKAAYNGFRPDIVSEVQKALLDQWQIGGTAIDDSLHAASSIYVEAGEYKMAMRLLGTTEYPRQGYLKIAVHKGQRWLKGGREDSRLDPHRELGYAAVFLPKSNGTDRFFRVMKPLAEYIEAHFHATNEAPQLQLERAQKLIDDPTFPTWLEGSNAYRIWAREQAAALAKAYSTVGEPVKAFDVLRKIPEGSEIPGAVEIKMKGLQQIVSDILARVRTGTLPESEAATELTRVDQVAGLTINSLENMPDGPVKDKLMAEIGADMYMTRAVVTYRQNSHLPIHELGSMLRRHVTKVWKIEESTQDPILKYEIWRAYARGEIDMGYKGSGHLDAAFVNLDRANFSGDLDENGRERLMQSYRDLAGDYIKHGFMDEAGQVAERMRPLAEGDKNTGHYVETLADVTEMQAKQIGTQLVRNHIGDIAKWEWNESDATLQRTGVPVWALMGYYKAAGGSLARVAADFDITMDEANAAFAYYTQFKSKIDDRLGRTSAE